MPKKITDVEKRLVCHKYREGMPIRSISAISGISQTTIMKILREEGVTLRENKATPIAKKRNVMRLYKEGKSIRDIMKIAGVKSEQTIYVILDEYKLERRRNTTKTESR